jgi:hypothetical protein
MTRFGSSVPRSATTVVRMASVLGVVTLGLLSSCSGGPSASPPHASTTTTTPKAKTAAAACPPSSVSASVEFTQFGGADSALAGGLLFSNTGSTPCSLRGVPKVQVVALDGQAISTYQAPGPATILTAVLSPGSASAAASSITFSDWTCTVGSFTLTVQFPGWTSSIPAQAKGSTTSTTAPITNATGPPCTQAQVTGQTIYISPVAPVTS